MPSMITRDAKRAAVSHDHARLQTDYLALTQRAGAIVQRDLGILRVEGRDRANWLHNLLTSDVKAMVENSAAYALLLEAKGHILADFVLVKLPEYFLLYTNRAAYENLHSNLRRAIFREQVTLADVSEQFGILSVQGPQSAACLSQSLNLPISESLRTLLAAPHLTVIPNPRFLTRFDILAPLDALSDLNRALAVNGADPISLAALNIVRVEAGIPEYAQDFDETTLAFEARLDEFISSTKGCYPGQETIARIRNLGHVNRLLVQLLMTSNQIPDRGDLIFATEKEIGQITSPVWSFAHNAPLALGYTKQDYTDDKTHVQIVCGDARLDATVRG